MKTRIILIAVCCIALVGCASYRLPNEYKVVNTRTYAMPQSQIMQRVLRWCVENEFDIVSKNDDVVAATSNLKKIQRVTPDAWSGVSVGRFVLDCGGSPLNSSQIYMSDNGKLSVTVTKISDTKCEVYVRLTGEIIGGTANIPAAQCNSTGVAESLLLDYIEGN